MKENGLDKVNSKLLIGTFKLVTISLQAYLIRLRFTVAQWFPNGVRRCPLASYYNMEKGMNEDSGKYGFHLLQQCLIIISY